MLKKISIISLCFLHLFTQAAWAVDFLPLGPVLSPPVPISGIVFGPNVNTAALPNSNVPYTYVAGNLTQVTDARGSVTRFEYDSQNRLVKTTDPLGKFETFSYDANGNLIQTIDRRLSTIDFGIGGTLHVPRLPLNGPGQGAAQPVFKAVA